MTPLKYITLLRANRRSSLTERFRDRVIPAAQGSYRAFRPAI